MSEELVKRLRDEGSYYRVQEKHWCIDTEELERQRLAAADTIEAQAAEIAEYRRQHCSAVEIARPLLDALETQAAEIERLREAGTKLAGFAGHDSECEDVTGAYPGSCSCGYSRAWKAWSAALGETE